MVTILGRSAFSSPSEIFSTAAPVAPAQTAGESQASDGAGVDPKTGTLSFSYPIKVPPGRNGVAPSLALSYSSTGPIYGTIASGWTLAIPEIREDHSQGRLRTRSPQVENTQTAAVARLDDRFTSTLGGESPLVRVTEPVGPGAELAYRAQHDGSWARYERMLPDQPFRWRVLMPDGSVSTFGDTTRANCQHITDQYAPLTGQKDSFGNEIAYEWESSNNECILKKISWGQNAAAGITEPIGQVEFVWEQSPSCTLFPAISIGATIDERSGFTIVKGAHKLRKIRATAGPLGVDGEHDHTREITLHYAEAPQNFNSEACDGAAAPFRQLRAIQESAWGRGAQLVELPFVTFTYNLTASIDGAVATSSGPPWADLYTRNLGWGYRRLNDDRWPSVEGMFIDIDGDGLVDRLTNGAADPATPISECTAYWQKNTSNQGGVFFGALEPIPLPRLKWRGTTQSVAGSSTANRQNLEGCSLNGQVTAYRNSNGSPPDTCHNNAACQPAQTLPNTEVCEGGTECPPGYSVTPSGEDYRTYLAYRWVDIVGNDGLPDLVAAVHGSINAYDVERGNRIGYTSGEPSISGIPGVGQWPACPQQDRCWEFGSCLDTFRTCNGQGICTYNWTLVNQCLASQLTTPCFNALARPPMHVIGAGSRAPYSRCEGLYPWLIYRNLGNGDFATTPVVKYQPIPLESEAADANVAGPSLTSQHHALIDWDGDGTLDAVAHAQKTAWQTTADVLYVWLGDGQGGFSQKMYVYPTRLQGSSGNDNALSGTGLIGSTYQSNRGLLDVNADGLLDHWLASGTSPSGANVALSDGTKAVLDFFNGTTHPPSPVKLGDDIATEITQQSGGQVLEGRSRSLSRVYDVDLDGRADFVRFVEMGGQGYVAPHWNHGGQYRSTSGSYPHNSGPLFDGIRRRIEVHPGGTLGEPHIWQIASDMIDLDGNGVPENVYFDSAGYNRIKDTGGAPRLLTSVSNGRGLTTTVVYADVHDTTTVLQNADEKWPDILCNGVPCSPKASPSSGKVVKSLIKVDQIAGTTATTSYFYENPRNGPDDDGKHAFRGFEKSVVTTNTGVKTTSWFDYALSWAGLPTKTLVQIPEAAPDQVHAITRNEWTTLSLFSGAVRAFQANKQESFTCGNGRTEAQCLATIPVTPPSTCAATPPASTAAYLQTVTTYEALPISSPALWVPKTVTRRPTATQADGDRVTTTDYEIVATATDYRVVPVNTTAQHRQSGSLVTYQRSSQTWDASKRVTLTDEVWVDGDPNHRLITHSEYHMDTGQLRYRWKPKQGPTGPRTELVYDTRRVFVAATINELGHRIEQDFDPGTGQWIEQRGPNERTCTSCPPESPTNPRWETERRVLDGLGRVVSRAESQSADGSVLTMVTTNTTQYSDSNPAWVETSSLVKDSPVTWRVSRSDLDGHGRTWRSTVDQPVIDHVTTYAYDANGLLVAVTVPDPSQDNASTVTYAHTYDSLGRKLSSRRPDNASIALQSGTNITYDGVLQTTTEETGQSGGPEGRTTTYSDPFGQITHVEERVGPAAGPTTTAITRYCYNSRGQVTQTIDASGLTVSIDYDLAGRKLAVTRPTNRTWRFSYDSNGNVEKEITPHTPSTPANELLHTTSFVFDDLDRIVSRAIAPRALTTAEQNTFASTHEATTWDTSRRGAVHSWLTEGPNGTDAVTLTHQYDGRGRVRSTLHSLNAGGYGKNLTFRREYNVAGSVSYTRYGDTGLQGSETVTLNRYDALGRPEAIELTNKLPQVFAQQTRNVAGMVTLRNSPTGDGRSSWFYDKLGRVTQQLIRDHTTTVLAQQDISYFGNDNVSSLSQRFENTTKSSSYTYDHQSQVASVNSSAPFSGAYEYQTSGVGRLKRTTQARPSAPPALDPRLTRSVDYVYSATEPDQVVALNQVSNGATYATYAYDPSGNQTSRTYASPAESMEYTYDGSDQLRRVVRRLAGVIQGSEQYWYDGSGQRVAIVRYNSAGARTELIWFADEVQAHFDGTGAATKTYAHFSMGTPVARLIRLPSSLNAELQFHGLGDSTMAVVAGGDLRTGFTYSPFGEVVDQFHDGSAYSPAVHQRRFNDKFEDDLSKLSYYGARYYDKILASWTQQDPAYDISPDSSATSPRRAQLYAFSLNNSLRYKDPDGRDAHDTVINNMHFPSAAEFKSLARTADEIRSNARGRGSAVERGAANAIVAMTAKAFNLNSGGANVRVRGTSCGSGGCYNAATDNITIVQSIVMDHRGDPELVMVNLLLVMTHESVHSNQFASFGNFMSALSRVLGSNFHNAFESEAYQSMQTVLDILLERGIISHDDYTQFTDSLGDITARLFNNACHACSSPLHLHEDMFMTLWRRKTTPYVQGLWGVEINPEGPAAAPRAPQAPQ